MMTQENRKILKSILEGYATNKLTQDDVILLMIELGLMKAGPVIKLSRISDETLKRLNKNVTIIIKGR